MPIRKIVAGLFLTITAFVMAAGTASAQEEDDPLVRITLPIDQDLLRVQNDSGSDGAAVGSPGVTGGNVLQVPLQLPINLCRNTIDIIGLLNATSGNTCINPE